MLRKALHALCMISSVKTCIGCSIADGTAFGEPGWTMAAGAHVDGDDLVFSATYKSGCVDGGSQFSVDRFVGDGANKDKKPALLKTSVMLVASRSPPQCASPSPFAREHTVEVRLPLPPSAKEEGVRRFISCPPGAAAALELESCVMTGWVGCVRARMCARANCFNACAPGAAFA